MGRWKQQNGSTAVKTYVYFSMSESRGKYRSFDGKLNCKKAELGCLCVLIGVVLGWYIHMGVQTPLPAPTLYTPPPEGEMDSFWCSSSASDHRATVQRFKNRKPVTSIPRRRRVQVSSSVPAVALCWRRVISLTVSMEIKVSFKMK